MNTHIFSPDFYNVKILKIYVAYLRDELGWTETEIEHLFEQCDVDISLLDYDNNWFNQELADRFYERLCNLTGDADIAYKVGKYVSHHTAKGIAGRVMVGLLSPASVYKNISKISEEYTKGASMTTLEINHNRALIRSEPSKTCNEKPYQCRNRTGILESIPSLFNLPNATIVEHKCIHRGETYCEYEVSWIDQAYRKTPYIAVVIFLILFPVTYTQSGSLLFSLLLAFGVSGTIYTIYNRISNLSLTRALKEQIDALRISHDTLERRDKESGVVFEINMYINRMMTIESLCRAVTQTIHEKMGYDRVTIFLLDKNSVTLKPASYVGFDEHDAAILKESCFHVRQDNKDGLLVNAVNTGNSIIVRDIDKVMGKLSARTQLFVKEIRVKSFVAVPIKFEDTIYGVITIDNLSQYNLLTENDKQLLEGVSKPIGVSFSNAISFEKLQNSKSQLEELVNERTQELVEARDDAVHANNAKSQFLANMSHELRTPLNAIMGFSQLINFEAKSYHYDQIREDSEKVIKSAKHLLSLISDLLDLSKIEAGKMDLHIDSIRITDMLNEIKDIALELAKPNRNDMYFQVEENLPIIQSDEKKLKQILLNLIGNACKFTADGKITVMVSVARDGNSSILFEVADTGIGISEEKKARIFKEFMQAESTTSNKYGGTGLGLSLCKKFTEMMGGEITLESIENIGTIFHVAVPIEFVQQRSVVAEIS